MKHIDDLLGIVDEVVCEAQARWIHPSHKALVCKLDYINFKQIKDSNDPLQHQMSSSSQTVAVAGHVRAYVAGGGIGGSAGGSAGGNSFGGSGKFGGSGGIGTKINYEEIQFVHQDRCFYVVKEKEHILLKMQVGESIVSMGSNHSSFHDYTWFSPEENNDLFELAIVFLRLRYGLTKVTLLDLLDKDFPIGKKQKEFLEGQGLNFSVKSKQESKSFKDSLENAGRSE